MAYRFAYSFVAIIIIAVWCSAQDKPAKLRDSEAIQGEWRIASFEEDGQKTPAEKLAKLTYVFKEGKAALCVDGKVVAEGTYKLDPDKEPKHINLNLGDADGLGIYKFTAD